MGTLSKDGEVGSENCKEEVPILAPNVMITVLYSWVQMTTRMSHT